MNRQWILLLVILLALYLLLEKKSYPVYPLSSSSPQRDEDYYQRQFQFQKHQQEIAQAEAEQASLIKTWSKIHYNFANPHLIKSWQLDGHNYLTAAKWIKIGVLPTEHQLVSWISNTKSYQIEPQKNFPGYEFNSPEWVIHYFGSLEPLRKEYYQRR